MNRYVVVFTRKYHILAKLIMFFTKSMFSHIVLKQIPETEDHDYILEATGGKGVHVDWGDHWRSCGHTIVVEYEVKAEGMDEAWAKICTSRVGKPYGWLQLVGDAYVIVRQWLTGKRVRNPFGLPWADVCSETVLSWILVLELEEWKGLKKLDPETASAEDLYDIIKTHPDFTELKN